MAGRVAGKVAFVSGLARGQGRAHAVRLACEGADIVGIDACADIKTNRYPLATRDDLKETVQLVADDISSAVLYLASDESRYVTGMQLRIDAGGYLKAYPFHL